MSTKTKKHVGLRIAVGIGLILIFVALSPARGQTVNWGNAANAGVVNFDSDGLALDATYTYSFGVFTGGFDPDVSDPEDWSSNWVLLDSATYNELAHFFSSAWLVTDNTYSGLQAYIWIYNQTATVDDTTEWVLITDADGLDGDDWTVPNVGDQTALPAEWRVSEAAAPVFGGLDDTQGPGDFTADPGTFELQTHSFPEPVPEPSVVLLLMLTGGAGMLRRRRSARAAVQMQSGALRAAVVAVLVVAPLGMARAGLQIDFRSTPFSSNVTSAGATSPMGEGFLFELGAFETGFTPGAANTDDWAANWQSLGRVGYNATTGWFTGSAELTTNAAPFTIDAPAYLWGFDPNGEWILLANPAWVWSSAAAGLGFPETFSVNAPGTISVVGTVSPDGSAGFQMMTSSITAQAPKVDPEFWRLSHFSTAELADPDVSGWSADPDDDGANNIEELAAGTNPRDLASTQLAELSFVEIAGSIYCQLDLPRFGRADIEHVLALSSNLQDWDDSGSTIEVVEDSSARLLLRTTNAVGAGEREFYRFQLMAP
ncbi:MAG: hypothetical protein ACI8XO_000191 [Verrucomicrobiales bacterium]|jgi:hypothetical protein